LNLPHIYFHIEKQFAIQREPFIKFGFIIA